MHIMLLTDNYNLLQKVQKLGKRRRKYFKLAILKEQVYNLLNLLYLILRTKISLTSAQLLDSGSLHLANTFFFISTPHRQRHYSFASKNLNKHLTFSNGVAIRVYIKKTKFFKKSLKSLTPALMTIQS